MPDPLPITRTSRGGASGSVTAFGAHALAWHPPGHAPVLFLSPRAALDGTAPIRGGIPVCFPWFGAGPDGDLTPGHGPVRSAVWNEETTDDHAHAYTTTAGGFGIRLALRFADTLDLGVRITRTGETSAPFELALHTYFAVSDATEASVTGLAGAHCFDQLTGESVEQDGDPIRFTGEYDRIFTGTRGPQILHDPGLDRRVVVTSENLPSAIVWNPGPKKAASMGDLGEDQYRNFVCIESARVRGDSRKLSPGESFEASVNIAVESLRG